MALNDGKTLKLLSGKEKSSRLCTSLSIDRENLFQFFLTFVKNAIQLCTCYKCPYKFSFLVSAFVFPLSCLLYGKYFFQASRSIANKRYEWQVTKSVYIRKKLHCCNESVGSNNMFWSNYFICICYHAGGSTKHFRRSKVKRCDEESSPSDALIPKKRKTRLPGKMRTYLWVCPLTLPAPPPSPIFPFLAFVK